MTETMTVLMPLPSADFDPTEVAISWQVLTTQGIQVVFATADGQRAHADAVMLSGQGLDPWAGVPGLKAWPLLGRLLRARADAVAAYRRLEEEPSFTHPRTWAELRHQDYQGLLLPGGHAPGMRTYLESALLQGLVADFFDQRDARGRHRPVAAICHGVVLAARARSKVHGVSVLHGRRTTALPWAMERSAWYLTRYWGRRGDPDYYRTYREQPGEPSGYRSVEAEVRRALARSEDFVTVPRQTQGFWVKTSGLWRDRPDKAAPAWVVRDGDYVSARWPGDAYTFARTYAEMLTTWRGD